MDDLSSNCQMIKLPRHIFFLTIKFYKQITLIFREIKPKKTNNDLAPYLTTPTKSYVQNFRSCYFCLLFPYFFWFIFFFSKFILLLLGIMRLIKTREKVNHAEFLDVSFTFITFLLFIDCECQFFQNFRYNSCPNTILR